MSETQNDPLFDLRFPVGRFRWAGSCTREEREGWVAEIAAAPANLRAAVAGLTEQQLETPYREGGWTVRQVAHHVPDSHMQAYTRFKLALTETDPVIKPYREAEWALLADTVVTPVETSLVLLEKLHERWVAILRSMTEEDWKRGLVHPELGPLTLERVAGLYAWHGRHHVAHIARLRERAGW